MEQQHPFVPVAHLARDIMVSINRMIAKISDPTLAEFIADVLYFINLLLFDFHQIK